MSAEPVAAVDIEKPLYNKLRVTKVTAKTTKQNDITDVLTYTAEVEKYEDGSWVATSDLTANQMAQINWNFIKNNNEGDTDILTDNPTNDTISVEGLEMSINVEDENIYQYGHAHAFVVDAAGYVVTELKRTLEVTNIIPTGSADTKNAQCKALLNVGELTED